MVSVLRALMGLWSTFSHNIASSLCQIITASSKWLSYLSSLHFFAVEWQLRTNKRQTDAVVCHIKQRAHSTSGVMNRAHLALRRSRARGIFTPRWVSKTNRGNIKGRVGAVAVTPWSEPNLFSLGPVQSTDTSLSLAARLSAGLCCQSDESNCKWCCYIKQSIIPNNNFKLINPVIAGVFPTYK